MRNSSFLITVLLIGLLCAVNAAATLPRSLRINTKTKTIRQRPLGLQDNYRLSGNIFSGSFHEDYDEDSAKDDCPFLKLYNSFNDYLPELMNLDFSHGIAGIKLPQSDKDAVASMTASTPSGKPNILSLYSHDGKRCPLLEALSGDYDGDCPFLKCVSKIAGDVATHTLSAVKDLQLDIVDWKKQMKWLFPQTVPDIDLSAFSGVYFLTHASALPLGTYLKNKFCSTAHYGAPLSKSLFDVFDPVSTFSVDYRGNEGSPEGPGADKSGMRATAWQFDPKRAPGKLVTTGDENIWEIDHMRVIRLGPLDEDGKYEYTVVMDGTGIALHVLARHPKKFREKWEKDLLEDLRASGWDDELVEPLPTYQGYDCKYPKYVYEVYDKLELPN